ncbi:MAG TPA: pitrilysin family protein [Gemmatimonadaceae bacterium]|nr:pitrilysin family protein [Gemmatimonadaceae bacterium]
MSATLAVPSSADASLPGLDPATVHRRVLANGLTVLVRQDRSAPVVAIVTYVKAGYFDETDDVVGIAHVLEHMFFKGTERRGVGEISKQTKAAGGYLNAHTIYDHTSYYAVVPSARFAEALDVQFDAYANSAIDAGELAKELEVIIQEAKRKADNPPAVATETLYELLHDRHRMRRWRIGREPGLRALTRDALVGFYRNFYRPSSTILSIAGDVDVDAAFAEIERRYGALPAGEPRRTPGPAEPSHRDFRYREWAGDVAQTQLLFGWRTVPAAHADAPLLDLAASALGSGRASRLYRAVRDRKLAASVSAYNYSPTELGVFVVHAETPPATAGRAACAAWTQLREMRDEGVGVLELERVRRLYESRWVRRLETMDGQANYLAEWEAMGDWRLGDRYLERLLCATPADVTEAVRRYLDPNAAGVVVYRPASEPPVAADAGAMRAILENGRPEALPSTPPRQARLTPATISAPTLEREEAGVRVYRTRSGVPILVRRKPGAQVVHLGVVFAGGAVLEGADHAGLTSLMTRTAVKGTERRTAQQIAEDAEMLGGSVGVSAGAESFGWMLSVPARHTAAALDLLADVVQRPTMPDDCFETERDVAVSEVAMLRDDMYRYPLRLATQAAFAGHPYGVPASGTEASLRALGAGDLREWHRSRVLAGAPVIAVVGDVDAAEVAACVARDFASLSAGDAPQVGEPRWPAEPTRVVESREKAQTALALLFPGLRRSELEERFVADIIAGIASGLGGRFFEELRDRQSLAYTVQAFSSERVHAGTFVAYIATSPDQEDRARRGLLDEFAKLREAPVTAEELERAQTYAIGTHAIAQQSGGSVLADVLDAWLFGRGLGELELHDTLVRRVTPAMIQAFARRHFDESSVVEGIVRGVGKTV